MPNSPEPTPKIFISYAWKNQTIAKRLQSDLQRDGVEVFVDYEKITGGDSLPERISAALDWCNTLVLLWSADSAESYYVKQEWSSAFHLQKKIIACVLDGTKLPALLSGNLYLNFTPYEAGYAQLCRSLGVEPKVRAEKTAPPELADEREAPSSRLKPVAETPHPKPQPPDPTPVVKPPEIVADTKGYEADDAEVVTCLRWWSRRKIMNATLMLIIVAAIILTWQIVCQKPRFRDKPATLSEEEVKAMLAQLGFYDSRWNTTGKGITHRYKSETIGGGKIVHDEATGLTWQQSGSSNSMTYADTEKYVRDLNAKNFAGHNDWRLPTLEEAMSLMESRKARDDLYIDLLFDRKQRWIWTADQHSAGVAWVAYFSVGYCGHDPFGGKPFVRVVR